MSEKRKILFLNGMDRELILLTEASKGVIEAAIPHMLKAWKDGKGGTLNDFLEKSVYARVLWDHTTCFSDDIDIIGYDETMNFADYEAYEVKTCTSMNCPFIEHCNEFSISNDKKGYCKTREFFQRRALEDTQFKSFVVCIQNSFVRDAQCYNGPIITENDNKMLSLLADDNNWT